MLPRDLLGSFHTPVAVLHNVSGHSSYALADACQRVQVKGKKRLG
jgi:hypothetical protein